MAEDFHLYEKIFREYIELEEKYLQQITKLECRGALWTEYMELKEECFQNRSRPDAIKFLKEQLESNIELCWELERKLEPLGGVRKSCAEDEYRIIFLNNFGRFNLYVIGTILRNGTVSLKETVYDSYKALYASLDEFNLNERVNPKNVQFIRRMAYESLAAFLLTEQPLERKAVETFIETHYNEINKNLLKKALTGVTKATDYEIKEKKKRGEAFLI